MAKINLNNQEAKVKTCAGYSDHDNCDAVVPVHSNSQEHEEHAKLEAQDANDIAVGSGISHFIQVIATEMEFISGRTHKGAPQY